MDTLNFRQKLFVLEYCKDLNATQAAIRAGYSVASAHVIGSENLSKPEIAAAIKDLQEKRAAKTNVTVERVLQELYRMASADVNELVEHRRGCCRYCWGKDFAYQETPNEQAMRRREYDRDLVNEEPFDERGGVGYNAHKEPNPQCPECFGEGVSRTFAKDTRLLSDEARSIYAGLKETGNGIELKVHSKDRAVEMLARHLGMYKEGVALQNPDGSPLELGNTEATARMAAILHKADQRRVDSNESDCDII